MATKKKEPSSASIRVMATQMGYYGERRRREGDVFDVPEHLFSDKWMVKVPADTSTTGSDSLSALHRQLEKQRAKSAQEIPTPAANDNEEI